MRIGIGLDIYALMSSTSAAALSLNFLTGSLDSRITFTRASAATYINSSGTITSAAIDAPRFDYNPSTLAALGLLLEEQRTNLFLNSAINGTALSTQSVTVAATPYTISFYGTGTITLSGTAVATITGAGVYPARQTLTFTPTAGTLTCTVSGSVQYAQAEAGSFVTSFVPTAGAAVTRSADVASMTGTNFSSWYNTSAGTFVFVGDSQSASAGCSLYYASDGTFNQYLALTSSYGSPTIAVVNAGVTQAALNMASTTSGVQYKIASAYAVNDFATSENGGAVGTDTLGTIPTATQIRLGSSAGAGEGATHFASLTYYNTRKSNAEIVVLST